jgi:hypothetical protein
MISLSTEGMCFSGRATARLCTGIIDIDLPALVGAAGWYRLLRLCALRHVLTHHNGIVDEVTKAATDGWYRRRS